MYPIPIFFILTESGVIPIPEGSVKKVVVSAYQSGTDDVYSVALLLKDGRLFTQGQNTYGEIGDGTTSPRLNNFYMSNISVADVFSLPGCFVVKYNSGGWQYIGDNYSFLGGTHLSQTTWTSFPSSITGTVTLANLKNVSGAFGNALWEMNSGQLYGSGPNTSGCLGSGNTNPVNIPRSISTVSLRSRGCSSMTAYVNNVGALRSCGFTALITGSTQTITSFATANLATPVGEPVYVRDFMTFNNTTIVFGAPASDTAKTFIYQRQITTPNYGKYTTGAWANGFDTYSIPPGNQNTFFIVDNKLYAWGQTGPACGIDGTDQIVTAPTTPTLIESNWALSDIDHIEQVTPVITADAYGHFLVYRGNLFYTGSTQGLFNTTPSDIFTQVPESGFIGETATSLTTGSIGIAIVGGGKQLTYQVDPSDAQVYQPKYTSSDTSKMVISATGMMSFVAEGGFDAGMTALNNLGETLSDSSGGYASVLSVYTESLSSMVEGDTQQLVATVSPEGAADLPDMVLTYTTTDPTIATVDANGVITAIKAGDCRIGCTATYQGTVTASDSSYLSVDAVTMDIDLMQEALPAGVEGSASNRPYYRSSGDTLVQEASTSGASLEYIGTTAQGRRIPMGANEQRAGFNTTIPSAARWVKLNVSAQGINQTSPAGTNEFVVRLAPGAVSESHSATFTYTPVSGGPSLNQGTVYTLSTFVKAFGLTKALLRMKGNTFTNDVTVDLTAGTVSGTGGRIQNMGNGWYRVMNTFTLPAAQTSLAISLVSLDNNGQEVFLGDGENGVLIWLPMMTQTPFADSPRQVTSEKTGFSAVSILIPRNNHAGVDVYYSNGQVIRVPFPASSETTFTLPTDTQIGDWGTVFVQGMRYYD